MHTPNLHEGSAYTDLHHLASHGVQLNTQVSVVSLQKRYSTPYKRAEKTVLCYKIPYDNTYYTALYSAILHYPALYSTLLYYIIMPWPEGEVQEAQAFRNSVLTKKALQQTELSHLLRPFAVSGGS